MNAQLKSANITLCGVSFNIKQQTQDSNTVVIVQVENNSDKGVYLPVSTSNCYVLGDKILINIGVRSTKITGLPTGVSLELVYIPPQGLKTLELSCSLTQENVTDAIINIDIAFEGMFSSKQVRQGENANYFVIIDDYLKKAVWTSQKIE